ncbi:hypothetical protein JOQ06_004812 [Pogonophryne albipinna]|uniref:Uncharacterized protein n=1 Tax=Pogonophryne albipinna TaxID=1090488 RepID=A0AAD6AR80_9TELE|nr:hypothetical protein JOQ06_004812 [Pogonophryne albipinna]
MIDRAATGCCGAPQVCQYGRCVAINLLPAQMDNDGLHLVLQPDPITTLTASNLRDTGSQVNLKQRQTTCDQSGQGESVYGAVPRLRAQVDSSEGSAGTTSAMGYTTEHSWVHLILCNAAAAAPPPQALLTPHYPSPPTPPPTSLTRQWCIVRGECSDTTCWEDCGRFSFGKLQ